MIGKNNIEYKLLLEDEGYNFAESSHSNWLDTYTFVKESGSSIAPSYDVGVISIFKNKNSNAKDMSKYYASVRFYNYDNPKKQYDLMSFNEMTAVRQFIEMLESGKI